MSRKNMMQSIYGCPSLWRNKTKNFNYALCICRQLLSLVLC